MAIEFGTFREIDDRGIRAVHHSLERVEIPLVVSRLPILEIVERTVQYHAMRVREYGSFGRQTHVHDGSEGSYTLQSRPIRAAMLRGLAERTPLQMAITKNLEALLEREIKQPPVSLTMDKDSMHEFKVSIGKNIPVFNATSGYTVYFIGSERFTLVRYLFGDDRIPYAHEVAFLNNIQE
ncbi:hypothetical protein J4464_02530 [Candidatus Woesearchaeota archaeon]|nr:hypothetical protein [Candidatus Woesearchaeota archaeon]